MSRYAAYRDIAESPHLSEYLGEIHAPNRDAAALVASERFECNPDQGESISVTLIEASER